MDIIWYIVVNGKKIFQKKSEEQKTLPTNTMKKNIGHKYKEERIFVVFASMVIKIYIYTEATDC